MAFLTINSGKNINNNYSIRLRVACLFAFFHGLKEDLSDIFLMPVRGFRFNNSELLEIFQFHQTSFNLAASDSSMHAQCVFFEP